MVDDADNMATIDIVKDMVEENTEEEYYSTEEDEAMKS